MGSFLEPWPVQGDSRPIQLNSTYIHILMVYAMSVGDRAQRPFLLRLPISHPDCDATDAGLPASKDYVRTALHFMRVQVFNTHILAQNLLFYFDQNPKHLIIGYLDP